MKKKRTSLYFPRGSMAKILLRMKLLTVFMLCVFAVSAAESYSQSTKFNFDLSDVTVRQVFQTIEENSEFILLYNEKSVDVSRKVNVKVDDESVESVLNQVFKGTENEYRIYDRQIVILEDENAPIPSILKSKTIDSETLQQKKDISGKVKDKDGFSLPGVSVVVKGTTIGTVTNPDGEFNLNIPVESEMLQFSFVGMKTQDVPIAGKSTFAIVMEEETVGVDEVVVTALGIERKKKTLTYATQEVDMDGLSTIKDINLGNALASKVAGVSITTSTGSSGVSGDPRIIIRGNRSIQNNNQPLIVVDGIPYSSTGGGLSSINPDDVQSMNVLKGPAASALYGSSANNGVIVVTTKSGKKGEPRIEVNSVSNFDLPYMYPDFQNVYGQGAAGVYQPNASYTSWGPKMSGQSVQNFHGDNVSFDPQPDNVKDLFRTGYNLTNSFSYSVGTDKSTTYFSYSNTMAQGVVEDNKMVRHNFNLRLAAELVKNLKMDFKMTYFRQNVKDQPMTGDELFSPMFQLIKMPRSMRTVDIENGSYINENYERKQNTWAPNSTDNINPYWALEGYEAPSTSNRVNSFVTLRYDFTDYLYLQLRGGMNISNSDSEKKTYWDTEYINSGTGEYYTAFGKGQSLNSDILLAFNKEIVKDLQLGLNVGAEIKDSQGRSQWSNAGGLTTENKFGLDYASNPSTSDSESRIQKQSVYGMGQLSYKNFVFLDVTARNDWSSTLPAPHSYFYPSVGLSGIITEMIDLPEEINFVKLRGSYAEVGNDASFASILQTFSSSAYGPIGMFKPSSTKVAAELIPENTKSWEIGADLKFLDNRLGIDFTWYKSNTYNQLVRITTPPTSGYSQGWINAGNIENKGVEIMLYVTPVRTMDFNWDVSMNFAKNNNTVIKLTELLDRYQIDSPNLSVGETWLIEGKPYGEIYTVGFERNDAGRIIVDALGKPTLMTDADLYLGNFNYDWTSGMTNNFSYKNWYMSFLIDLNYGGVRQSASEAMMDYCGTSVTSLEGREGGIVVDGVKEDGSVNDIVISAEDYFRSIGGRINHGSGELYNHEATNSRLREFSLGYTFPMKNSVVKSLRISAVGRNLFYIYNGCEWFDPDVSYNISRNGQGAESAFLPGTRTLGVNIKITL